MILAIVKGEVVSTVKHRAYEKRRLLLVDRIDADGAEQGGYLVAVDSVGAGVEQTVLVIDEGSSAQQVLQAPSTPIRSVVVAIVDQIAVEQRSFSY